MTTMTPEPGYVTGGVDTHLDIHVAAAVDHLGGVLGTETFPTTGSGYRRLLGWLSSFGPVHAVGVEGTGSYGSALAGHLTGAGLTVIEVSRPNRQVRRRYGKTDVVDAIAAARAVLSGQASATAKAHTGPVEALRLLKIVQRSATKSRTQAVNQLRTIVATAPDELRSKLRALKTHDLIATCAAFRVRADDDSLAAVTRLALRELAQRIQLHDEQLTRTKVRLHRITTAAAPELVARKGIGPDTASTILVSAGDNPHRLRSERSFASLAGANPIPASSGKTTRHRLNRGGDRQLNSALCGSRWCDSQPTPAPAPISTVASVKGRRRLRRSAASSATSPGRSSRCYREKPSLDSRSIGYVWPATPTQSRTTGATASRS